MFDAKLSWPICSSELFTSHLEKKVVILCCCLLLHFSSPPHISFDVLLDTSVKYTYLVTAVRSFTRSLSKHLIQVPQYIEQIKTTTNLW